MAKVGIGFMCLVVLCVNEDCVIGKGRGGIIST